MKEQPAPENLAQDIYEALQAEVFPIGNYAIHIIQKVLDRHEVNTLPIAQQQSVPVSASEYFEKHKVVTVTHEVPFLSQEDFMQYAAQSAPKQVPENLDKWYDFLSSKGEIAADIACFITDTLRSQSAPKQSAGVEEKVIKEHEAIEAMRRGLNALRLEVDSTIVDSLVNTFYQVLEGQQLQSQQQEDKVIEEVKEYMDDLDSYFQKEEIKDEDLEKKIVEILKTEIHYSPQVGTYVIHGAVQSLLKLKQKGSEDKIAKARSEINLDTTNSGD